uniref:Uncharacterized protein n=1 Tax=Udotea sp. TZ0819 TaxID=2364085 RepID=A0A386B205_9CHLO|nr:hypothetical protein [Udotea sp. TZ0819]
MLGRGIGYRLLLRLRLLRTTSGPTTSAPTTSAPTTSAPITSYIPGVLATSATETGGIPMVLIGDNRYMPSLFRLPPREELIARYLAAPPLERHSVYPKLQVLKNKLLKKDDIVELQQTASNYVQKFHKDRGEELLSVLETMQLDCQKIYTTLVNTRKQYRDAKRVVYYSHSIDVINDKVKTAPQLYQNLPSFSSEIPASDNPQNPLSRKSTLSDISELLSTSVFVTSETENDLELLEQSFRNISGELTMLRSKLQDQAWAFVEEKDLVKQLDNLKSVLYESEKNLLKEVMQEEEKMEAQAASNEHFTVSIPIQQQSQPNRLYNEIVHGYGSGGPPSWWGAAALCFFVIIGWWMGRKKIFKLIDRVFNPNGTAYPLADEMLYPDIYNHPTTRTRGYDQDLLRDRDF